jgi:hypothetical protein
MVALNEQLAFPAPLAGTYLSSNLPSAASYPVGTQGQTFDQGLMYSNGVTWQTTPIGIYPANAAGAIYTPPFVGGVATTVSAKLAQTISVLDFGADPTGATDSTAAFTAAVTAAIAGGLQVIVPGGTYRLATSVTGPFIAYGNVTITGSGGYITTSVVAAAGFLAEVPGGEAGVGSRIGPVAHANWNIVQSTVPYNPTEWQVYTQAANGIAQVIGGTNQVVLVRGTPFASSWVGQPYFFFEGTAYKVASLTDTSHLTVTTPAGGAVSFGSTVNGTFFFVATTVTAIANVSGTSVTWVSGQPFINFLLLGLGNQIIINGTTFTVATFNSPTSLTLTTSAGTLTNATCVQWVNIANELATYRLQTLFGADGEGFNITATPQGTQIYNGFGGAGKYRPIFIQTGESPAGTLQTHLSLRPNATLGNNGILGIGGDTNVGNQVIAVNLNSSSVNYLSVSGTPTTFNPAIAARGADTNVGLGFDTQAAAGFNFTSHNFGNTEFQIFGVGGSSWLAVGSSSSAAPAISANGAASNISIQLLPKGTGVIVAGAPVQLQAFTVATLPAASANNHCMAVVTDAVSPTYNGTLTGGGSITVPVFSNGAVWLAH